MADGEASAASSGSGLKILLIILIVLLLVGGAVGGMFAAGMFSSGSANGEEDLEEEVAEESAGPAQYIPIDPAFVVNFNETDKAKFLQITMEVMTRNPGVEGQINTHMPAIRNNLVMLFSSQTYDKISTLEGKEELREEALTVVQEILEEETGDPGVEAVYFTSIVMQ